MNCFDDDELIAAFDDVRDAVHGAVDWFRSLKPDEAKDLWGESVKRVNKALLASPKTVNICVLWGLLVSMSKDAKQGIQQDSANTKLSPQDIEFLKAWGQRRPF